MNVVVEGYRCRGVKNRNVCHSQVRRWCETMNVVVEGYRCRGVENGNVCRSQVRLWCENTNFVTTIGHRRCGRGSGRR